MEILDRRNEEFSIGIDKTSVAAGGGLRRSNRSGANWKRNPDPRCPARATNKRRLVRLRGWPYSLASRTRPIDPGKVLDLLELRFSLQFINIRLKSLLLYRQFLDGLTL